MTKNCTLVYNKLRKRRKGVGCESIGRSLQKKRDIDMLNEFPNFDYDIQLIPNKCTIKARQKRISVTLGNHTFKSNCCAKWICRRFWMKMQQSKSQRYFTLCTVYSRTYIPFIATNARSLGSLLLSLSVLRTMSMIL